MYSKSKGLFRFSKKKLHTWSLVKFLSKNPKILSSFWFWRKQNVMFFIQFLYHNIIVKIGDRIVKFGTQALFWNIWTWVDLGRAKKILGPAENDYSCLTSIIIWGTCESCNCNGALASFSKNPILVSLNILKNEFQNCDSS